MPTPTILQRVEAARRHLQMSIGWKGETLGVLETRRHYTNYFKGIPHFKEYRSRLVTSNASEEVFATLADVERAWGDYEMV
jgi:tRNA-dihydrouridine synthase